MSASEKLKRLEQIQEANPSVQILEGECKRIFPQIVAVASAAERVYMIPDDHGTAEDWVRGLEELDEALAALDKALS